MGAGGGWRSLLTGHFFGLWRKNRSHHLVKVRPRSCSTSSRKLIISELSTYFKTTLGPRQLWRSIPEGIQCRARNCWTGFYWGRPSELNLPSLGTFIFYFINCRKALNRLEQSGCATPSDLRRKFNMFMERGSAVSITSDPQQCFHAQLLKPALRDTDSHVDVFLHDSRWQQTFSGSCSVFGTGSVCKANCSTGILVSFCSTEQIFQQFPLNKLKLAHSFTCQRVKNSRKTHRPLLSKATQPLCLHRVCQSFLHPQFPSWSKYSSWAFLGSLVKLRTVVINITAQSSLKSPSVKAWSLTVIIHSVMPWTKIKISHYESWGTGHFSHQRRCSSAVQPQTRGVKRSLILIKKDFKTPRDHLPTTSSACFVCFTCLFSSFLMQSLHYSQRWADYVTPERQTCFSSGDPTWSEVGKTTA